MNTIRILEVRDCGLVSLPYQLSFDFEFGACGSYQDHIMICFHDKESEWDKCRYSTDPRGRWTRVSTVKSHQYTRIGASDGQNLVH